MIRFLFILAASCGTGCDAALLPADLAPARTAGDQVAATSGLPAPAVLYPRHRIFSPTPPIVIALPAGAGTLEIEIVTPRASRRLRSRDRLIPWPGELPALRPGDVGWLRVSSPLGSASSGFVRVLAPTYRARWLAGPEESVDGLSGSGLPMEAFRLAAAECRPRDGRIAALALRAGLPRWGAWRPMSLPGSIPADIPDP